MKISLSKKVILIMAIAVIGVVAFFATTFQNMSLFSEKIMETPQQTTALPPATQQTETTSGHESRPSQGSTFRENPEIPSDQEMQSLPDCSGKLFSANPVDLGKITEISPLGNIAPPGHTFPTEHVFFHITAGGQTTDTIPLYSPADVHITLITFDHGVTQDPVDYTIWFALCKDVIGYFNHVKEISSELQQIVSESQCKFQGEDKSKRCNIETLESVETGKFMGRVGRLQGNFDFGLLDLRKTLTFANPDRYGTRSLHIQCPFDYYNATMKAKFFDLFARTDGRCGTTAQDAIGTLKGNWFFGNARADLGTDWDKYLAFVQDNEDTAKSVVSIGGVFITAEKFEFTPQSSGLVNREFTGVTPDGNIYCYEGQSFSGKILVQLVSKTELKIERQDGSCTGSFSFSIPTNYNR